MEEAATRMGVSVATVRRRAAAGDLVARKSGKQWLIDGERLAGGPRRRARRETLLRSVFDVPAALAFVKATDINELWVPDILRFEDQLAEPERLVNAVLRKIQDGVFDPAVAIPIPKTPFFTRSAVLLTLEDRIAFQAVVGSVAARIDAALPAQVMSARVAGSGRWFLQRGPTLWKRWQAQVQLQLVTGQPWMVKTDLTAYFDHISHRLLIEEVSALNPDPRVVTTLRAMLRAWAQVPDMGLPQGPNAARVLGNLFLLPVDRVMLDAGYSYHRFMDDIRIVGSSKADVISGMRLLEQECRNRGLIISSSKTQLLEGTDAIRDGQHPDRDAAQYSFDAGQATARPQLRRMLRAAIHDDGHVQVSSLRFSLWRLARLREYSVLTLVLKRLEDLAPVASVVAAYLQPFVSRDRVVNGIADYLEDPSRAYSTHLVTWMLALMMEHPGRMPPRWSAAAGRLAKDRNQPPYLRALASVILARGGRPTEISWIKSEMLREYDPDLLRGYAVALHWEGALDRATESALITRAPGMAETVAYLRGRTSLPSLVYTGRRLPLPG